MTCARDRGLRVPDDIAVAGFDDIAMLQDVTPGLTTVHIDLVRVGVVATRLTLESTARQPRIETITGTVVDPRQHPGAVPKFAPTGWAPEFAVSAGAALSQIAAGRPRHNPNPPPILRW